jgi:hypothetical protein
MVTTGHVLVGWESLIDLIQVLALVTSCCATEINFSL